MDFECKSPLLQDAVATINEQSKTQNAAKAIDHFRSETRGVVDGTAAVQSCKSQTDSSRFQYKIFNNNNKNVQD